MPTYANAVTGWVPDVPDFRDWTPTSDSVRKWLGRLRRRRWRGSVGGPAQADLRQYFPEPFEQGLLPASSANACAAMIEYFEWRAGGRSRALSRLFLHRVAGRIAGTRANAPVGHRVTLKAVARCGLPPEDYWPYTPERLRQVPDGFLYSFREDFRGLRYVRLDGRNHSGTATLDTVRAFLAAGFPAIFGIPIPSSISRAAEIPYRPTLDSILGGQSLVAVGYDDHWLSSARGALLVRNSWGRKWGDRGYGWLPYAFVEQRLAVDFWTVMRPDWLKSGEFSRPRVYE
jgi:C1A family cysteine protease